MKTDIKKLDLSLNSIEPLVQKISALTKVQRIMVCCAMVVLIVGGFVYFLYMPKYDKIAKAEKEMKQQEKTLKESKKSADQLPQYEKQMADAQVRFKIAAKALPEKNEVPSLLTNISQVGKDAGLEFLLFKPEPEKLQDFYAELPITMQLEGSYHDLGSFFDQLASMSRIVNINKFEMQSGAKKGKIVAVKGKKSVISGQGATNDLIIAVTAETYKFVEFMPEAKKEDAQKKGKKAREKKTKE